MNARNFGLFILFLVGFFIFAADANALSPLNVELEISGSSAGEIRGNFILENRSDETFTDLKYVLYLKQMPEVEISKDVQGIENESISHNEYLIKAERSTESIISRPKTEEKRDFAFSYPKNILAGEYEFSIEVVDEIGDVLTFDTITGIKLEGGNHFLEIKRDSCFVIKGEEKFLRRRSEEIGTLQKMP